MKLADCHPSRKEQARGMCKSCYNKWLKSVNPIYKSKQDSASTKWAKANPERMKELIAKRKLKQANDPEFKLKRRNTMLKNKYGITLEIYNLMLSSQNNSCKICNRLPGKTPLHVDHDHKTGKVRGLLCHQCNWYLGSIDSDPEIISRIIKYLGD